MLYWSWRRCYAINSLYLMRVVIELSQRHITASVTVSLCLFVCFYTLPAARCCTNNDQLLHPSVAQDGYSRSMFLCLSLYICEKPYCQMMQDQCYGRYCSQPARSCQHSLCVMYEIALWACRIFCPCQLLCQGIIMALGGCVLA